MAMISQFFTRRPRIWRCTDALAVAIYHADGLDASQPGHDRVYFRARDAF
jgi:hypothetical protein